MDCPECRRDGNPTAPHTIPGSQPEEQVKKDDGDPVRSIIRAKDIDVSNNDGVAGSRFGAKLACDDANGKMLRDVGIIAGVVTGGARGGKVVCDDRTSGLGAQGEELGPEDISAAPFRLS
jgi:hypothetical protein